MQLTLIKDENIRVIDIGNAKFCLIMLLPHIGALISIYFWYRRGQISDFISMYLITILVNALLLLIAFFSLNLKVYITVIILSLILTLCIVSYYFFVYQCYKNANEWKIKQLVKDGYKLVNEDLESKIQLEIICSKQRSKFFFI